MRKKIYILAYFARNLGDDIFVRTLLRRYPQEKFYIFGNPHYVELFRGESNAEVVRPFSYRLENLKKRLLKYNGSLRNPIAMKRAKAVVHIGGSIFIEHNNWRRDYYLIDNKNSFTVGANFGPWETIEFYEAAYRKIENLRDCCFRDYYSYGQFNMLPNVRVAPDILFGKLDYIKKQKKGHSIGISIIELSNRPDLEDMAADYYDGIISLCEFFQTHGVPVKLFSFCEREGDERAVHRIINSLASDVGITLCFYTGDIDSFLDQFDDCNFIYATRFHAMVLGWNLNKTVVPIIYSNKQLNVIRDIGYSGYIWNLLHGDKLDVESSLVNNFPLSSEKLEDLASRSEEQFMALDMFISNS